MDGKILMNAIVNLKGKELRVTYAFFNETNLLQEFYKGLRQAISRDKEDFLHKTTDKILESLKAYSDEELQLYLIEAMSACVDVIPRRNLITPESLVEEGNDIVFKTLELARKRDKNFKGITLDEFLKYQLKGIFERIDKEFAKNPDKGTTNLQEAISQLSPHVVEEMKRACNVNEFSSDVLRRIMFNGGSALLFSSAVNLAGFAFYTTASTMLAWVTGLFGVTLPFSAYIGLSTSIAFLSGPIFLTTLGALGGVYLLYGNSVRQERLLPGLIAQLILSHQHDSADYQPIIEQWKQVNQKYTSLQESQTTLISEQENLKNQISHLSSRLDEIKVHASEIKKSKSKIQDDFKKRLSMESNLKSWKIDDEFSVMAVKLSRCRSQVEKMRMEIKNKTETFFSSIRNSIELAQIGPKIMSHQHEENSILAKMAEAFLQKPTLKGCVISANYAPYVDLYRQYVKLHNEEISINKEEKQLISDMVSLKKELSFEKNTYNERLTELNALRKRHPRLQYIGQ